MSCFIGGLRANIKHDVSGQRPRGILEAYWFSKVYENAATAKKVYYQMTYGKQRGHVPIPQYKVQPVRPVPHNTPDRPAQQGQGDRPARQCWYCKEPWNREHRCRQGKTLHIMQEIDEEEHMEQVDTAANSPPEPAYHTAPNTPDNSAVKPELMQLSAHALEGTAGPATFSLLLQIANYKAVALVDSGSSHTFMNYKFAIASNLHLKPTNARKIAIAGGGHLTSTATVPNLEYSVQGHQFSSNFHILALETYDVILGIDWMYAMSPVTLDLPLRLLSVCHKGKTIELTDHTTPPEHCILSEDAMNKLLSKPVLGYLIQIHAMQTEQQEQVQPLSAEIEQPVRSFDTVFSEPTELPPSRPCDHSITLQPGAQPPNLRPYRVPHVQKDSMEEIITKLLKSGEIQLASVHFPLLMSWSEKGMEIGDCVLIIGC